MNIKTHILILFAMLSVGFSTAYGQSIEVVRTDVDSTRSNFVTATYTFGVDIYIKDVENCNGASFELLYNMTDYIIYSGSQNGDLGRPGEQNIRVVVDPANDVGRVIVGVGSGSPLENPGLTDPKAIHLEFVVLKSAVHIDTLVFNFLEPRATINNEGVGEIINLQTAPVRFAIHSFIDLWPGDTDNNGIVNHLDFNVIDLFMGRGSRTNNMRSFKRENPSAIWNSQKVLAWDSAAVTFADCDGNGEITNSDKLIVYYNLDSTNDAFEGAIKPMETQDYVFLSGKQPIHINAVSDRSYRAVLVELELSPLLNNESLISIIPDLSFGEHPVLHQRFVPEENKLDVLIGTRSDGILSGENRLFSLSHRDYTPIELEAMVRIESAKAISPKGNIFSLGETATGVNEAINNSENSELRYENSSLLFTGRQYESIAIFNISGQQIAQFGNVSNSLNIALTSGVYIVLTNIAGKIESHKLQVVNF